MTTPVLHCLDNTCTESTYSLNVDLGTVTVSTQLNSVASNTLANTDLLSPLLVASIAPSANQFVGTDNLNQLGWQDLPLAIATPEAIYYATAGQNFNSGPIAYMVFNDPASYNNAGVTWNGGLMQFVLPIDQVFEITLNVMVTASASSVRFDLVFDGTNITQALISATENNGSLKGIVTTAFGNADVQIAMTRVGADTTAKTNYSGIATQIVFKRIA